MKNLNIKMNPIFLNKHIRLFTKLILFLASLCLTTATNASNLNSPVWFYDCDNGCSIYTFTKNKKTNTEDPSFEGYIFSILDTGIIAFAPVWDNDFFTSIYTTKPSIYKTINGQKLVITPHSEDTSHAKFLVIRSEESEVVSDKCISSVCYFIDKSKIERIIDNLTKSNTQLSVFRNYVGSSKKLMTLSNKDFNETLSKLSIYQQTPNIHKEISKKQAIESISKKLKVDNIFSIKPDDLTAIKNKKGKGYFVYVPKTNFYDIKRNFIWYVNDEYSVSLNSPSKNLSSAPWPRDVQAKLAGTGLDIWEGSGLTINTITKEAMSQAFKIE